MKSIKFVVCLIIALSMKNVFAGPRIASLNPCFDEWVPQWLPRDYEFIKSTTHGNRLERLLALAPDAVLYGTYTNRRLLAELQKATRTILVHEPNSWAQWQTALETVGKELSLEDEIGHWAAEQQRQLAGISNSSQRFLFVMPNQYSWGGQSFAVDLMRTFDFDVMTTSEQDVFTQISLETLIHLQPDVVILDGFSSRYARANDWLWHNALQPWLSQRQATQIEPMVSGCPAQQAVTFVSQAVDL